MSRGNEITAKIFKDKNINKDERYVFLALISAANNDEINSSLNELIEMLQWTGIRKLITTLNSLKEKNYIEIIKVPGKNNVYKIINEYKEENQSQSSNSSEEKIGTVKTNSTINFTTGKKSSTVNLATSKNSTTDDFYKTKETIYINIFNTWNKININKITKLNPLIKNIIHNTLKKYSEKEIIQAIENYGQVYHSNHYYSYDWMLTGFLSKPNGINRFLNSGDMWLQYHNRNNYENAVNSGINIGDFID